MEKNRILKTVIFIVILCVFTSGCISGPDSTKGTIQLTSSPSGAQVYFDNQFQGSTPSTIANVEQGNHTLEFRYPGYQSWSSGITVLSGTSHFYAALSPLSDTQLPRDMVPVPTTTPKITIQSSRDRMVVGNSIVFSGTCIGCDKVLLTIFGPGKYSTGIPMVQQNVNEIGSWSFTWNPGQAIQEGTYTVLAEDGQKTTSGRVEFTVTGGGEVSVTSNSFSVAKGDSIRFSGRCTTGAQNVLLVLYGPERYSSGVELGTLSVMADKTWNFKYLLDPTMPTGVYTMYVYDIPKTTFSTTQFTVGFASDS